MITLKQLDLNKPDNLFKVKQLHNILFPNTDASMAWMFWFFNDSKRSKRAYGALDGDELVGLWCVEPKRLLTESLSTIPVGRCFGVGIHPNYRRHNLFVELSRWAIWVERDIAQYDYILGFPQQGRPVVGGHLKAGWERVQLIDMHVLEPKPSDVSLSTCDITRTFDFARGFTNEVPGSFLETERELSHRWLKHPHNYYIVVHNGIKSYLVLKQYADMMHVLDIHGSLQQVNKLLFATRELAYRHHARAVTMWCAANDPFIFEAKDVGFKPVGEGNIEMLAVKIRAKKSLILPESHFSMGGEESF